MGFQLSLLLRNFITILVKGPVSLVSYKIMLRSLAEEAKRYIMRDIVLSSLQKQYSNPDK